MKFLILVLSLSFSILNQSFAAPGATPLPTSAPVTTPSPSPTPLPSSANSTKIVVRVFSASWCPACIKFWDLVTAKNFVPKMPISVDGKSYEVELKKIDVSDGIEAVKNIMTSVSIPEIQILYNDIRISVWVGEFASAEAFRGYVEENVKKAMKNKSTLLEPSKPILETPILLQKKKPSDERRFLLLTSASSALENQCSYSEELLEAFNTIMTNHGVLEDSIFTLHGTNDFEFSAEQCAIENQKLSFVEGLVPDFSFQAQSLLDIRSSLKENAKKLVVVANGKLQDQEFHFWDSATSLSPKDFASYLASIQTSQQTVYLGSNASSQLLNGLDCIFLGNMDIEGKTYLNYMLSATASSEKPSLIQAHFNALKTLAPKKSSKEQTLSFPQTGIELLAKNYEQNYTLPQTAEELEKILTRFPNDTATQTFIELQNRVTNTLGYPLTYFSIKAASFPFTLKAKTKLKNEISLYGKFEINPEDLAHIISLTLEDSSLPLLGELTRKEMKNVLPRSLQLINLDGKFTFAVTFKSNQYIEILSPQALSFDIPEQVALLFALEENPEIRLLYLKMTAILKRLSFQYYASIKNPEVFERITKIQACENTSL